MADSYSHKNLRDVEDSAPKFGFEEVQEARLMAQIAWNLPPDLLPEEPLPTSASLTVSGTRSAIRRARGAPVRVVVDLSEMGAGAHEVGLESAAAEGLPSGVEVAAVSPFMGGTETLLSPTLVSRSVEPAAELPGTAIPVPTGRPRVAAVPLPRPRPAIAEPVSAGREITEFEIRRQQVY